MLEFRPVSAIKSESQSKYGTNLAICICVLEFGWDLGLEICYLFLGIEEHLLREYCD